MELVASKGQRLNRFKHANTHNDLHYICVCVCVFVQSGIVGVKESEKWMKKGGVGVWRVQ